ncbi:MAG: esterase family protein [Saprospiraceae bacterium]|jgi:enterochelin esterase family protein|nr:esterase family protein [Saprospiraceae bacterium]HQU95384.1 alpha/beta hydrolase-fold protein [Saprospiraceae bacterium]HQW94884.1 alpha/beta hydrolase-fold protein [Saprospiraceae bacterium]
MINSTFSIYSSSLNRSVELQLLSTTNQISRSAVTIFFNDGQDFSSLKMVELLKNFEIEHPNSPLRLVGIRAQDRIHEYGCIYKNDYINRGNKAKNYNHFIRKELIPYLKNQMKWKLEKELTGFAGFSLGGLSAMDLTLHNSDLFSFSGVFSGSFWWRYKPFTEDDPDGHRILHEYIDLHEISSDYRFWFQAGTKDEESDRNNNSIIDSIDDTLHLMDALEQHGYSETINMTYVEVENGTHDTFTWGKIMPQFLTWAILK